jgi:hypothetical protein
MTYISSDPTFALCIRARAAEEAAGAACRLHGGEVPPDALNAADEALSTAYATTPKSVGGIAMLARLVLDVECPDPAIADALRSIERAAIALARN